MAKTQHSAKQDIVTRVRVLYLLFIAIGLLVAARLVWVQSLSPSVKHNAEVMSDGMRRVQTIPAHRGAILSRDGEPLALSSVRYHATIDFASEGFRNATPEKFDKEVSELARLLAAHFSKEDAERNGYTYISEEQYRDIFLRNNASRKERGLKIFPRTVTLDEWNMFKREWPIFNQSLGYVYDAEEIDQRIYPSDDLARQIIGRNYEIIIDTARKSKGSGIEYIYDDYLAGHNGKAVEQRIAHGFWTRINDPQNKMPEDGANVVTTIDAGLQKMATERLREQLEKEEASFGVAMVMEVATGNILCMVNLSSGKVRGTNYNEREFNHAMRTAMNPGSTIKLASAMALVELCGFTADSTIHINGASQKVGAVTITDSHDVTRQVGKNVTLRDGFAHSSNIFFAKAVYDRFNNRPEVYTKYLESLMFNDYVGLQAFGEARGNVPHPGSPDWNRQGHVSVTLPRLGYGYILEVPPVHTLTFYNGVANGGRMVAPRLVDHIERDGEVVETMPVVTLMDRMCSPKTIDILHECMAAAATPERTVGHFKRLPTTFGCKTGTAQVWNNFQSSATKDRHQMKDGMIPKYDHYYLGSIVTMMPFEQPKYTIMVSVTKQQTDTHPTYYGISLTGPVANDIMEYIYTNDPTLHAAISEAPSPYSPTSIKGGRTEAVRTVTQRLAPYTDDQNCTEAWSRVSIDGGGNASIKDCTVEDGIVPNVVGMGLTDALYLMERCGLEVAHRGQGRVTTQSIAAGTPLDGTIERIELTLER